MARSHRSTLRTWPDRLRGIRSDLSGRVDYLALAMRATDLRVTLTRGASTDRKERSARSSPIDNEPRVRPRDEHAEAPRVRVARAPRSRPKVAILAWDVGHNPLGRAYVLAGILGRRFETEIWGAQFKRYGSKIWAPLRDCEIPIHVHDGQPFPAHLDIMEAVAREIDADAIYVSKPRLPSFGIGVLAKMARNRPLVLDVDDDELAFFGEHDGISARDLLKVRGDHDVTLPFGRLWTRVCDPFIAAADARTVSNRSLAERYDGLVVPHARDERRFDPARYDRSETRRRLGISESQRLLLFGGTPRAHKGVVEVVQALEHLDDDRYRILIFGTREFDELRDTLGPLERWVTSLPYQSFDDLPRIVGAADLACVLQDPNHPVSQYQMPAKITDALAMRVPCLVTPVPPLDELIGTGVLHVFDGSVPLHQRITEIFDDRDDAIDRARRGREVFEETYSYEASSAVVAPMFERLLGATPSVADRLAELVEIPRQRFRSHRRRVSPPIRIPGRRGKPIARGGRFDVVVFWKQNDTGIYGRRQDMFVKYLARSNRVRSIVHFDNPTTPETLYKVHRRAAEATDQGRLIVRKTARRLLPQRKSERVRYQTFLYGGRFTRRLGLPRRERYPDYVRWVLERRGLGDLPIVAWVYPTNPDLPWIIDDLDPEFVIADVVDDNRTWHEEDSALYDVVEQNYEDVLARSDLVLANCEPVAEAMKRFAPEIHVIPNGCELPTGDRRAPRPKELQALDGPIVGYVGNLSSRIDLPLLEALIRAHRSWQFVFLGSAHLDRSILRLEAEPNAHFLGVKPYEEMLDFVAHFDVGLIPHVDNDMTRSMNPLKAFVYCAAGVPVVSTPVANLDGLASVITIAEGPVAFGNAIEDVLRRGRQPVALDTLRPLSWESRVARTLELIDEEVAARG